MSTPREAFAGREPFRDGWFRPRRGGDELESAEDAVGARLVDERGLLLRAQREASGARVVSAVAAGRIGRQPFTDVALDRSCPGGELSRRRRTDSECLVQPEAI